MVREDVDVKRQADVGPVAVVVGLRDAEGDAGERAVGALDREGAGTDGQVANDDRERMVFRVARLGAELDTEPSARLRLDPRQQRAESRCSAVEIEIDPEGLAASRRDLKVVGAVGGDQAPGAVEPEDAHAAVEIGDERAARHRHKRRELDAELEGEVDVADDVRVARRRQLRQNRHRDVAEHLRRVLFDEVEVERRRDGREGRRQIEVEQQGRDTVQVAFVVERQLRALHRLEKRRELEGVRERRNVRLALEEHQHVFSQGAGEVEGFRQAQALRERHEAVEDRRLAQRVEPVRESAEDPDGPGR